jgi:alanyl-tRNA synthetase
MSEPVATPLLYLEDPDALEFQAFVLQSWRLEDGRWAVILDRTYFYPTGGGQEHDTGWLGEGRVVEVYKQGEPALVVHVIDRQLPEGNCLARIDAERRLRHRQHHTAQHLLTQCFLRLYDLETLSANINGYTPSTLDLPAAELSVDQLDQAELLANRVVFEDRLVRAQFVDPAELERLALRRQPKVSQNIRLVEIEDFDATPCGGTHCNSTGQIGLLKILRSERMAERLRIHFIAGLQALEMFRQSYATLTSLAAQLSVHPGELCEAVQRINTQLSQAQKTLQTYQLERLDWEAAHLWNESQLVQGRKLVVRRFDARPAQELRGLANRLRENPSCVAVLASWEAEKVGLVVACGVDSGVSALNLLHQLLVTINGRGGGDAALAQGGGLASRSQCEALLIQAESLISA